MLRTAAKYSNADRNGGSSAGLVALVLVMVEPVAQPPECVPGHLVGDLCIDLRCERDPAVPEDGHRDARVNVERSRCLGLLCGLSADRPGPAGPGWDGP